MMNRLSAIKRGRQCSNRSNAFVLLCVVLSPQGCYTFSVTPIRQFRTRQRTITTSFINEQLSRTPSISCLFAAPENSSIACSDQSGNLRKQKNGIVAPKFTQPPISKSPSSLRPLDKKTKNDQGARVTINVQVRLENSNRAEIRKPLTPTKSKEKPLVGVIQTTHNIHHHTDNLEGAVYGMTSLLVLTYLTIFLATPAQIDPFSPSELCWATTNGYIVALIAHFLRREERLRRHAQNLLLCSEVEPCETGTLTSVSVTKKKENVKQPSVKAAAVDCKIQKPITLTTTTTATRSARIINSAVFALLAKKSETTVINTANVQKPKITQNDFFETLRAFQKDAAAAKKSRKKSSSNKIHESIP